MFRVQSSKMLSQKGAFSAPLVIVCISALLLFAPCVSAATLLEWDYQAEDTPSTTAAGIGGSAMTAAGLNLVQRYDYTSDTNIVSWVYGLQAYGADANTASWGSDYIEFTMTADPGSEFTLSSVTTDFFWKRVSGGGYKAPATFNLLSSDDYFTSSLGSFAQPELYSGSNRWSKTFNLSGTSLNGKVFTELTFRLYVKCGNATNSTKSGGVRVGVDDLKINGSVQSNATQSDILFPDFATVKANQTLTFDTGNYNPITLIGTLEAADEVTLSVSNGTLFLSQTTGLIFSQGNGVNDASMTFGGSLADVNAALDGLQYVPSGGFSGRDALTVSISGTQSEQKALKIAVNTGLNISADRSAILSGVSGIHSSDNPGKMFFFGSDSYAISHYPTDENHTLDDNGSMIVAASWGQGRAVVVPDYKMLNMSAYGAQSGQFVTNSIAWLGDTSDPNVAIVTYDSDMRNWLTGQGYGNVVQASEPNLIDALSTADVFVPGYLGGLEPRENLEAIADFVAHGGGLLIGGQGEVWWMYELLREPGVAFVNQAVSLTGTATIKRPNDAFNGDRAFDILGGELSVGDEDAQLNYLTEKVDQVMSQDDPFYLRFQDAKAAAVLNYFPTPDTPVSDELGKSLLLEESNYLKSLPPDEVPEHRVADAVYGDLVPDIERVRQIVHIPTDGQEWSSQTKWQPTGLYCPPGEMVLLRFPSSVVGHGLKVRVSNDGVLTSYNVYKQSPLPTRTFSIVSEDVQVANHMGGAIFIIIPSRTNIPSFDVEIMGAVKMPYFRLGQMTNAEWVSERRDAVPEVCILETDNVFNMSTSVGARDVDDMEASAQYWQDIIGFEDYARAWDRKDLKPNPFPIMQFALIQSMGGFNSGISANWGASSTYRLFDPMPRQENLAPGGWLHESGHSHQKEFSGGNSQPWRPGGDGEANANVFYGIGVWYMVPGQTDRNYGKKGYLNSRKGSFNYAWNLPNVGIGAYPSEYTGGSHQAVAERTSFWVVPIQDFNWNLYRDMVIKANLENVNLSTRAEESDWCMQTMSELTGYDFTHYFERVGSNVGQAAKDATASLPDWYPICGKVETFACSVDTAKTVDLTAGAYTIDGIATLAAVTQPGEGAIVDNGNGTITYTPASGYVGTDSFLYTLESSKGFQGQLECVITVGSPTVDNVRPVAGNDVVVTDENTPVTIDVLANDSDPDGDAIYVWRVHQAQYGTAVVNGDNTITYTPNTGFSGEDIFQYYVLDGHGGCYRPLVRVTVNNTVNDAPYFDSATISKPNAKTRFMYGETLKDVATDPDAQVIGPEELTFSKVSGPGWLIVEKDGALSGTPEPSDAGLNTFTVRVTDTGGASDDATLSITVYNNTNPQSDFPPSFTDDLIVGSDIDEYAEYAGTLAGTATDPDGNTLYYAKVAGPLWLKVAEDGSLTGAPTTENIGLNTFYVMVKDGLSGRDWTKLQIRVLQNNRPPNFHTDPIVASGALEYVSYRNTLAGSASDPDGNPLSYSKVSGPSWLKVASDGRLSGTPTIDDLGLNVFTAEVSDGRMATDQAALEITVYSTTLPLATWNYQTGTGPSQTEDGISGTAMISNGLNLVQRYDYTSDTNIASWVYGFQAYGASANTTTWASDYIEFTVNATGSDTFVVNSVTIDSFWKRVSGSGYDAAATFYLLSSDDNFASFIGEKYIQTSLYSGSGRWPHTFNLTGTSLAGKEFTTLTFRLYVKCANDTNSAKSGGVRVGVDDLRVIGRFSSGPPKFISDPVIKADAIEDADYSSTLSSDVFDPDIDDVLIFTKTAGPAWLTVKPDGSLIGTPANSDVGSNNFTVEVDDGNGGTDQAVITIAVLNIYDGDDGMYDWAVFASNWLQIDCTDYPRCGGCDLDGNANVEMPDLRIFAERWLGTP